MNIVAFDLSLTASGYATTDGRRGVLCPPKPIAEAAGTKRLRWIRLHVLDIAIGCDLAVIEGYAFGAKGRAILNIAEMGGVVRTAFADRNIPYVEIPPASLKMFATGKGTAKKNVLLGAAIRELGFLGTDDNEVDALWLLTMATAKYSGEALTGKKAQALEKIKWPKLSIGEANGD